MSKVEKRLTGDPAFRRRNAGGAFYPLPVHMGVVNPVRPGGPR